MQFRKCSIAGVSYGKGTTEMGLARLKRLGLPLPEGGAKEGAQSANKVVNFEANPNPNPKPNPSPSPNPNPKKVVNFEGPELHAALNGEGLGLGLGFGLGIE